MLPVDILHLINGSPLPFIHSRSYDHLCSVSPCQAILSFLFNKTYYTVCSLYLRLSFLWDVLHLFQHNIGPYKMSAINILQMFFLTFIFLTKETKSAKPTINILHMFSFILYCSFLQHITPYVSSVPGLGMSYIQANYIYPSYLPISKLPPYIQAIYIYPSYLPISKLPTYIQATYIYSSYLHISKLPTHIQAAYIYPS